jgi:hypothetical protein
MAEQVHRPNHRLGVGHDHVEMVQPVALRRVEHTTHIIVDPDDLEAALGEEQRRIRTAQPGGAGDEATLFLTSQMLHYFTASINNESGRFSIRSISEQRPCWNWQRYASRNPRHLSCFARDISL